MSLGAEQRLFFATMPRAAWSRDFGARLTDIGLVECLGDSLVPLANLHQSFSERIFLPTDEDCAALMQVGAAVSAASCTLHFNRIVGPASTSGPIHWAMRARGVPPAFTALLQAIQSRLVQAGFGHIATGVTPHMTLSYGAPEPLDKIVLDPPIRWTIDELCLVIDGGHPYRYDIIGRWPLLPEIDPPATQAGLF